MSATQAWRAVLAFGIAAAVVGEGGATPTATLVAHGAIAAAVAAAILRAPGLGPSTWRLDPATASAAVGLGFVVLASAARAPYGYGALLQVLEIAAFLGVVVIAARLGPQTRPALLVTLAPAAVVLAGWAVAQRALLDHDRPAATFLNPNHLAAWSVAFAAFAAPVAWRLRGWRRTGLAFGIAAALVAIVLAGSRGAALGLTAGAATIAALTWSGLTPKARRVALGLGLAVVVAGTAIVLRRAAEGDPFAWHRAEIWKASLSVALEHPALGTGPGQFANAAALHQFDDHDPPLRFDRAFSTTHSDYLRAFAELGTLGALVGALVVFAAVAAVRRGGPASADPTAVGAIAALAALASQATVDNLTERPAIYLLAAALGGSLVAVERERQAESFGPAPRRAAVAALALLFAVAEVAPYLAWRDQRAAGAASDSRSALASLDRAARRNPGQPHVEARRAELLVADEPLTSGAYAAAREAAERAVRLDPQDGRLRLIAARVEARGCAELFRDSASRDRALARYREAESRLPRNALVAVEAGEFLLRTSDPAGALRAAERARRLEPRAVTPRVLAAAALIAVGALDRARLELTEVESLAAATAGTGWESAYARNLMTVDPRRIARLREAVAAH